MTRTRTTLCCCALGLSLCLVGCFGGSGNQALKRTYAFSLPTETARSRAEADRPVLGVPRLDASPIYEEPAFVYRLGAHRYHQDFYNEFVLPPALLVTQALRRRLEERFVVVTPRSLADPDLVLEGTLVQIFADREPPAVLLELELRLLERSGGAPRLLWSRRYHRSRALDEFSPENAMAGWDALLTEILDEAAAELPASPGGP